MTAAADTSAAESDGLSPDAQPHVVNRPTDDEPADADESNDAGTESAVDDSNEDVRRENIGREAGCRSSSEVVARSDVSQGEVQARHCTMRRCSVRRMRSTLSWRLMDYTCPHCRKMHAHLREAMDRYGDQLAVVILPMPLELDCNKLVPATDPSHRGACKIARTALAVAEVDPSKFLDFHNFLMAERGESPRRRRRRWSAAFDWSIARS